MKHILLIGLAVVLGFVVRLHSLTTPLADWHSWRQADTASVTREYLKHNYDLLHPHFHDLSNIPNGLDNPQGWRMVEFPIENYAIAALIRTFPQLDLVVTSRMVSILCSLISIIAIYSIVFQLSQKKNLAFCAAMVVALLPYSIYYSRVVLPEPAMIMVQLVSFAAFIRWVALIKAKRRGFARIICAVVTIVMFMLALLLKPTAAFMLPVFAVEALCVLEWKAFTTWELYLFPILIWLPLIWWRKWIAQFPTGIPAFTWLLNGNGIRLHPAWWRWLFADRLGRLISGYWGVVFLTLGFLYQETKKKFSTFDWVTLTWAGCMFAYLVVIATGNVQHDYYQTIIVPLLAVLFSRGVVFCIEYAKEVRFPILVYGTLIGVLALTGYFSWNEVGGYFGINHPEIVDAGKAVDALVPADAKVIAPYQGDTAFLFQTNRTGWPIGGLIDEKIKMGASYYVTTTEDDEAKALEKKYTVVKKTNEYVIIHL